MQGDGILMRPSLSKGVGVAHTASVRRDLWLAGLLRISVDNLPGNQAQHHHG
jgi:hypothetical protein